MNTNFFKKLILLSIMFLFTLYSTACTIRLHPLQPPYMVDRTEGWELSFPDYATIYFKSAETKYVFSSEGKVLLDIGRRKSQLLSYGELQDKEAVIAAAELALKDFFKDDYIDMGTEKQIVEYEHEWNTWYYCGGETYVAFDKSTGILVGCIDIRIQTYFSKDDDKVTQTKNDKEWFLRYHCNLEDMTPDQLRAYHDYAHYVNINLPLYAATEQFLPVTPQTAYNVTFELSEERLINSQLYASGAFNVYYCETSDSWFVSTDTFLHVIARETGERLLLIRYNQDSRSDQSREIGS